MELGGVVVKFRRKRERDERGLTLVDVIASFVITGIIVVPLTSALFQAVKTIPSNGGRVRGATDTSRLETQLIDDINQMQQSYLYASVTNTGATSGANSVLLNHWPPFGSLTFETVSGGNAKTFKCFDPGATAVEKMFAQLTTWDASANNIYPGPPVGYFAANVKTEGKTWVFRNYNLRFTRVTVNSLVKVEVFRSTQTWDWTRDLNISLAQPATVEAPLLTGYCKPNDTVVTGSAQPVTAVGGNQSEEVNLVFSLRGTPTDPLNSYTIDAVSRFAAPPG